MDTTTSSPLKVAILPLNSLDAALASTRPLYYYWALQGDTLVKTNEPCDFNGLTVRRREPFNIKSCCVFDEVESATQKMRNQLEYTIIQCMRAADNTEIVVIETQYGMFEARGVANYLSHA